MKKNEKIKKFCATCWEERDCEVTHETETQREAKCLVCGKTWGWIEGPAQIWRIDLKAWLAANKAAGLKKIGKRSRTIGEYVAEVMMERPEVREIYKLIEDE